MRLLDHQDDHCQSIVFALWSPSSFDCDGTFEGSRRISANLYPFWVLLLFLVSRGLFNHSVTSRGTLIISWLLGDFQSFLDVPGLFNHFLTFNRDSCHFLAIPKLRMANYEPGPGERTLPQRSDFPIFPSLIDFSECFCHFLVFPDLLPLADIFGCFCRFLVCLDILAISWLTRTSLSFLGFSGHPCHFMAFPDIPVISWLFRTFLPFPGFTGHSCHLLAFSDVPAISWLSRTSLPFPGFLGHPCHFLAF
ncbi:hypothetical protein Taro_017359 [Colocasia esculenta]|uniref:Uncharacterized protein n=1 Tax=Colocasia esculenta TaxID=4460 RepID=A0A843UG05_COLES|nr:hypothetical protein [Colocasia esculenta]